MGAAEPKKLLTRLVRAFPDSKTANSATMSLFAENLTDIPPGLLEQAVAVLARTEKWFPSLARIREVCAELALDLPTEADALRQIHARIAWGQLPDEGRPAMPIVHDLAANALAQVGGFYAVRSAENPTMILGQFGRIYREERERAVRDMSIGSLPELASGPEVRRSLALQPRPRVSC